MSYVSRGTLMSYVFAYQNLVTQNPDHPHPLGMDKKNPNIEMSGFKRVDKIFNVYIRVSFQFSHQFYRTIHRSTLLQQIVLKLRVY